MDPRLKAVRGLRTTPVSALASESRRHLRALLDRLVGDEADYYARAIRHVEGRSTVARHREFPFGMIILKPVGPRCNLRCDYCYQLNITTNTERTLRYAHLASQPVMTLDLVERICRQIGPHLEDREHFVVNWHGGEPMLAGLDFYRRALDLFARWLPSSVRVSHILQTNATLIDAEWCAFFKAHGFIVNLALDGPRETFDQHRRYRGEHASPYQNLVQVLHLLQEQSIPYAVISVFAPGDRPSPRALLDFWEEQGLRSALGVKILPSYHVDEAMRCPPLHYADYLIELFDRWVSTYTPGSLRITNFHDPLRGLLGLPIEECYTNCGDRLLCFETNGDAWLCSTPFTREEYRFGNLVEQELSEIVNSRRRLEFLDRRHALLEDCRATCEVFPLCWGSCSYHVTLGKDERWEGKTWYCEGLRKFFGHVRKWVDTTLGVPGV